MFTIRSVSLMRREIGLSFLMIDGEQPGLGAFAGKSLVFSRSRAANLRFGTVAYETVDQDVFEELFLIEMPFAALARFLFAQRSIDVVFTNRAGEWVELYTFSSVRWLHIQPTLSAPEIDEAKAPPVAVVKTAS